MGKRAAVYIRISDDREGLGLGVDRQETDCRLILEREGWEATRIYRENDTSAFKRKRVLLPGGETGMRVVRPAFRQMLADLASGEVTALVAYDLDRVARDPRDLEDLIDVVEGHHVPTRSVTGSLDLSNDAGITMARVMVAVANKASRDQSRRIRRKYVELAENGQVGNGGYRPFGYTNDRLTVVEDEAVHLRWAYAQVLTGRSLRSIATDLTARGVLTTQGGPWSIQGLRWNLLSPRNAALREHRKVIIGPAVWPPIVDRTTWEQVRAILTSPARRPSTTRGQTNSRRHLLTGFLRCDRCGGKLVPRSAGSTRQRYGCLPTKDGGCGGRTVHVDTADLLITELVLARLEQAADLTPEAPEDPTADLLALIAADEARLEQLAAAFADDPDGNPLELRLAGARIRSRIEQTRADIGRAALQQMVADPLSVRAAWPGYDLKQRRHVISQLLERIDVGAGVPGRFDPRRLTVVWR